MNVENISDAVVIESWDIWKNGMYASLLFLI